MKLDFFLVDVFSDRPFGGNQLAVFPEAAGIPDATMQQLAREFNFSETTFVLPPRDPSHTCQVRIFTPYQELPFAGHPTVGTAAVLASLNEGKATGQHMVFEEGIGPVAITIDGAVVRFRLASPDYETTSAAPPAAAIAKAVRLPADVITESWYAGIGLKFCFVRLASRELVDRAVLDMAAWQAETEGAWSRKLYLFAGDYRDGGQLHSRFFAPTVGVHEDPATGSACAALIASLAQRSAELDGSYRLEISQGVAMGRPSMLEGTARKKNGQLTEVAVGGRTTLIGNGTVTLPAASHGPN